jgi:hypothetical protein
MKLFIKSYADDLKSPSTTYPLLIKTFTKDYTLAQLKKEIELQVKPTVQVINQILSIKKSGCIVSHYKLNLKMRIICEDCSTIE